MDYSEVINLLSENMSYAKVNLVPIIRTNSANILFNFVRDYNVKKALEIGTAIGFSGSIILSAGAEKLTTIDINEKLLDVARQTFEKLNFSERVEVMQGDAKDVLQKLVEQNEKFDFVFLDGPKGQYYNYLPYLTKLLNVDGVIFADNVLLQGLVESNKKIPHKKRTMVTNIRKYLESVNLSPFESYLIRVEDGISITKYKGENS